MSNPKKPILNKLFESKNTHKEPAEKINKEEFIKTIKSRRSVRIYNDEPVLGRHEAEAAAAPPLQPALQPALHATLHPALHAGGGAPRAAPPSGQRPPVMPPVEARHPSPAAAPVRAAATPAADGGDEAWCRRATREQKVTPGSSWGSLAKAGEEEWMRRRCDRFFCQPHAMESRGVYRCVPVGVPVEQ